MIYHYILTVKTIGLLLLKSIPRYQNSGLRYYEIFITIQLFS